MSKTQIVFDEILDVLLKNHPNKFSYYKEHEVRYLNAKDSDFWMSNQSGEFVVGFGQNHTHFSEVFGNLRDGVQTVLDLLSFPIKTTSYKKGNAVFRIKVEIVFNESNSKEFGVSKNLIYPFWKKTSIIERTSTRILDERTILNDFEEILLTANQFENHV